MEFSVATGELLYRYHFVYNRIYNAKCRNRFAEAPASGLLSYTVAQRDDLAYQHTFFCGRWPRNKPSVNNPEEVPFLKPSIGGVLCQRVDIGDSFWILGAFQ